MKKLASTILSLLVLSSTFTFLSFSFPGARADSSALSVLEFNAFDDLTILYDEDTILLNLKHHLNMPASPLADIYRQAFSVLDCNIEEEMPIPESVAVVPEIVIGGFPNASENSMPIREQFYRALSQEYDSSLGLDTIVVNSSMVPIGDFGEFRIYVDIMAFPQVSSCLPGNSGETWILGLGPADPARFAEYVFTQVTFLKMLLQQLPGEQVYKNAWSVRISLPDDDNGALLNCDELSALSWLVDLGGGNYLEASTRMETRDSLTLNETMIVTEQNMTMPIEDLGYAFEGYKSFMIKYSTSWVEDGEIRGSTLDYQILQESVGASVSAAAASATGSITSSNGFSWSYSLKFPTLSKSGDSRNEDELPWWPPDGAPEDSYLTYEASLDLVATFSVQWDPTFPVFGLDYFRSSIRLEAEARLDVEAGICGWTYSEEFKIFEVPVTKLTFFIGPVPVYVDLTLGAKACLDIEFTVGPKISAGCTAIGWIEYGVEYSENGGLTFIDQRGMTGEFIPPTLTSADEIVAEVTPSIPIDLWAKFYAIAGPDLVFEPYITAIFSYSVITQKLTIEVTIGLKISFVFRLDDNLKKLLKDIASFDLGYEWDFALLHYVWAEHHDVGIKNLKVAKPYIYRGDIVDISVIVKNQGFTLQHDMISFDVKVLCDDIEIGMESVSDLAEGSETTVGFTWDTSGVPIGKRTIKAELLNINPAEEVDENDYAKNDIFETEVEISPVDFYITYASETTWYKPGETTETVVWVKNLRPVRTAFWFGVSFKDSAEESEKYDPQISKTPESATLNPEETASFVVTWTIPADAPFGWYKSYQIALNCWEDDTFREKYIDNIEWADVFYVYELQILLPTTERPAPAGDPENPNAISVSVRWIPTMLSNLLQEESVFSAKIGDQSAGCELQPVGLPQSGDDFETIYHRWLHGLYELRIYPPAQLSEGLYDLNIAVTMGELTDSGLIVNAVEYTSGLSAEPTSKGLAWLRTSQYSDGSWRSSVGVTALCVLAFLNAGYDETDPDVNQAIQYLLSKVHPDGSIYVASGSKEYETSLAVLALVATYNDAHTIEIDNARNWLVNSQWDESCLWGSVNKDSWFYGGFGYGYSVRPDLSNTQFVALALDAAGLPKDDPAWTKLQVFLHRCQRVDFPITLTIDGQEYTVQPYNSGGFDGGFGYTPGSDSWGSMTGAGIWGLMLSGVSKNDPRVARAIDWVVSHYTWETNPGPGSRAYYYYLSMAKALTLYGEKVIGGHDWYQDLYSKITSPAEMILEGDDKAKWIPSGYEDYVPDLPTAYAILSLQTRASAPPVQRLSYLTFILNSNSLIRILDPEGNLVGYNYVTGLGENNLPTAIYSGPLSETQYVVIVNPKLGTYKLELVGTASGSYELVIQGNYGEVATDVVRFAGPVSQAMLLTSDVDVTSIVGPIDIYADPPSFKEIVQVRATVEPHLNALNLKATSESLSFHIELPEGQLTIGDIVVSSICLNNTISVSSDTVPEVGDWDNDGTLDLALIFSRSEIADYLTAAGITNGEVSFTLTGLFSRITSFEGSITISVSTLIGDVNCDAKVDIYDVVSAGRSYRSSEGEANWNPNANFAKPWTGIDIYDLVTIVSHFGEEYP